MEVLKPIFDIFCLVAMVIGFACIVSTIAIAYAFYAELPLEDDDEKF